MAWGGTYMPKAIGGQGNPMPQVQAQSAFQQNLNQGIAYNQPQFLQNQLQQNAGYRNLQYGQAGYGNDQAGLNLGYQSDSRDLALQQGQNGIDLRAAQRQPQLIDQLLGLDNQDYGLSRADAGLAAQKDYSAMMSDATARGATASSGRREQQKFIYDNLANQMGHIDVSQGKNTLNAGESKAQAQDRIDALNMTAGRLGMKGDELKSMLGNQLTKLGLQHTMSVDDILDGISSGDLQSKQLMLNLISQAGQYATNGK